MFPLIHRNGLPDVSRERELRSQCAPVSEDSGPFLKRTWLRCSEERRALLVLVPPMWGPAARAHRPSFLLLIMMIVGAVDSLGLTRPLVRNRGVNQQAGYTVDSAICSAAVAFPALHSAFARALILAASGTCRLWEMRS